jgi:host factor-I protein
MAKSAMNLQDSFLNQVRKDGSEVKVLLLDGTQIKGQVKGFDSFTLIVQSKGIQSLIYKHAIAQMVSPRLPSRREAATPPEPKEAREAPKEAKQDPKKPPGFNKMDLSSVKLESDSA